jgi:hypothetical protein
MFRLVNGTGWQASAVERGPMAEKPGRSQAYLAGRFFQSVFLVISGSAKKRRLNTESGRPLFQNQDPGSLVFFP